MEENSCNICYDNIREEKKVSYSLQDGNWSLLECCKECFEEMLNTNWFTYVKQIKEANCEHSLKSCIKNGIPSKLTNTFTISGEPIIKIKINNILKSSTLKKSITEEENEQLNHKLHIVHNNIIDKSNCGYDYLYEIQKIFEDFVVDKTKIIDSE